MCKKLFATKIVASSFLGFANNLSITFDFEESFKNNSFKSLGDNENNATSEAATIAQQKSKMDIPINPKIKSVFKDEKNVKLGSGSKIKKISYTKLKWQIINRFVIILRVKGTVF